MIKIYSLPNCGICNMIKTKMKQKNIPFEERPFEEIALQINSDHAPAIITDSGEIYNSPTEIVAWINKQ